MKFNAKGLYAITDPEALAAKTLQEKTRDILRAGAKLLQYRCNHRDKSTRITEARQLQQLCQQFNIPFIINNDIALAVQIGADGIHLGKNDPAIAEARTQLGRHSIIGCSCYDDLQRAEEAVKAGADYLAFGAFFPSPTKPEAIHAEVSIIRQAKQQFGLPIVAIGGITTENGHILLEAGADMLAVISGLYRSATPFETTKKYIGLFNQGTKQ